MLKLRNINKSYPQRGIVFDGLCLDVSVGETIAVMGPSGSGKTTLLNIIGLLDKPDSGEIFFREKILNNFSNDEAAEYRNKYTGFIFQDHLLLPYLTIIDNILLPLFAGEIDDEKYNEKRRYVMELMQKTGIDAISEKYPFQVSGGEAQRAALVRALINKPDLLLADEPTGALDAANAEILGDLLKEISSMEGTTVVLATHSEKLAKKMSVIYKIEEGKLSRI
ncbi:MAG: ABC transporter ATP-binding protein [Bacteroidales bacterium]|nr:ABC transporter ATP-binding protein [Bacteroidales bacterium]